MPTAVVISFWCGIAFGRSTSASTSARAATSHRTGPGLLKRKQVSKVPAGGIAPGGKKDEPEPEPAPRLPDEHERVFTYRVLMLEQECGFNILQAEALAVCGVDWHEAKSLIDRGCDHNTAVDLLT